MTMNASPWLAGGKADRQLFDQIEKLIGQVQPNVKSFPEPRWESVEVLDGRITALAEEVKAARKNQQDFLFHRARLSSVLADVIVLLQVIKDEAEALSGERFPTNAEMLKFACEVKQAAHSNTLPFKLPVDEHGFIRPLTSAVIQAAEAKRKRRAETRKKRNPAAHEPILNNKSQIDSVS